MIKLIGLVLFLLLNNVVANTELVGNRHKRSLYQFKTMIECTTNRSAFDFNNYGCYCGWGGSGEPVDGIDGCCLNHDRCYDRVAARDDCWPSPKWRWYSYFCERRTVTCNADFGTCDYHACMCDKEMAQCITQYNYNQNNKNIDDDRCEGETSSDSAQPNWCLQYGDVNGIDANGGLPSNLARLYSFSTVGQEGSFLAADDDAASVLRHERCLNQTAHNLGLQPALLAALASRISMGGRLLSTNGYNTIFPHLWGLVGCDTRVHSNACVGRSVSDCGAIERIVRLQLVNSLDRRIQSSRQHTESETEYNNFLNTQLKATLTEYLSGFGEEKQNFVHDVLNRAKRFDSYHLWRCTGDRRFISHVDTLPDDSTVAPTLSHTNRNLCTEYIETGNCDFYATCIENRLPCERKGFAISRAANFCFRYREYYNNFTQAGQRWIDSTQRCLMETMRNFLARNDMSCPTLYDLSNRAELACMKESGFCGMISDNLRIIREVYNSALIGSISLILELIPTPVLGQRIADLVLEYILWPRIEEAIENHIVPKQEREIWELVYDMFVSCKYNCETRIYGTDCGAWYMDAWHWFRSHETVRDRTLLPIILIRVISGGLFGRRKRSIADCSYLAETKDCQFWKCIDEEYGCTSQHGGNSMVRDFRLPFCYRQETVSDAQTRALLDQTERCVMTKIVQAANSQENECVDIEFEIVSSQAECLKESGFCGSTRAIEWALSRLANVKTFPSTMPREFGKFTTDGKLELLSTTYFRWLQFLKQQIGDAQRACSPSAPELYEFRFNDQMQTMVKYRIEL